MYKANDAYLVVFFFKYYYIIYPLFLSRIVCMPSLSYTLPESFTYAPLSPFSVLRFVLMFSEVTLGIFLLPLYFFLNICHFHVCLSVGLSIQAPCMRKSIWKPEVGAGSPTAVSRHVEAGKEPTLSAGAVSTPKA